MSRLRRALLWAGRGLLIVLSVGVLVAAVIATATRLPPMP